MPSQQAMKVAASNGRPKRDGNNATLLRIVLERLAEEGIKTELIQMAGRVIAGCIDCRRDARNQDCECALPNEGVYKYIAKMAEAHGVLLGSPTYPI
jgi:multimeric flavodoxin WrbA